MIKKIKKFIRVCLDRIQCRPISGIEIIGGDSSWALCVVQLPSCPKILSGGVGNDITFEYELVRRFRAEVALFDPSPTGCATIDSLSPLPEQMRYCRAGLAGNSKVIGFAKPQNIDEGSWRSEPGITDASFQCFDYDGALNELGWVKCDVIKIDIEGFEYEFLGSLRKGMHLPMQIAVEMHGFLPGYSNLDSYRLRLHLHSLGYRLVWKRRQDHLFVRV